MRRALRRDRHTRQFVRKEFLLFPAKPSTEIRSHKVFLGGQSLFLSHEDILGLAFQPQ